MTRFFAIKCVSCGQTVRRKPVNAEPFSPIQTCLVCGKTTNLLQDIPLDSIKKISSEACETLVKGCSIVNFCIIFYLTLMGAGGVESRHSSGDQLPFLAGAT